LLQRSVLVGARRAPFLVEFLKTTLGKTRTLRQTGQARDKKTLDTLLKNPSCRSGSPVLVFKTEATNEGYRIQNRSNATHVTLAGNRRAEVSSPMSGRMGSCVYSELLRIPQFLKIRVSVKAKVASVLRG
jgi:hypothetical protein